MKYSFPVRRKICDFFYVIWSHKHFEYIYIRFFYSFFLGHLYIYR